MPETPAPSRSLPDAVPAQIWMRSGRSWYGTALRVYLGLAPVAAAFLTPRGSPAFWAWVGAGVVGFTVFPLAVQAVLRPLGRRVDTATRSQARALLGELRARRFVRLFAPNAWTTLQEARLQLRLGEGRAAAKSFAETARLSRVAGDKPSLVSAQAHCLLLAGDRREARELLGQLRTREQLGPLDRLHLAIALLLEGGPSDEARELLADARAALGEHPRVLAAESLEADRRGDREAAAATLAQAEQAQAKLEQADRADDLAADLLKRAHKALRGHLRDTQRQRGKKKPARAERAKVGAGAKSPTASDPAEPVTRRPAAEPKTPSPRARAQEAAGPMPGSPTRELAKGSKKARQHARREERRATKSAERARRQAEREAAQRQEAAQRREALRAAIGASAEEARAGPSTRPAVATSSAAARDPVVAGAPILVTRPESAQRPAAMVAIVPTAPRPSAAVASSAPSPLAPAATTRFVAPPRVTAASAVLPRTPTPTPERPVAPTAEVRLAAKPGAGPAGTGGAKATGSVEPRAGSPASLASTWPPPVPTPVVARAPTASVVPSIPALPRPPLVPPPPRIVAPAKPAPSSGDDGWGDALAGLDADATPSPAKKS